MNGTPQFSEALLAWFIDYGRKDLPWQKNTTPYRVWISEIMLQQTQVATVTPYYQRFMQQFPSISLLASASEDEVLHLWTGLGYYARARNLHKCAKHVVKEFNGEFPNQLHKLTSLPGIGRSTAGAILALAFKQQASILDGNVKRVLSRYFMVDGWTGQAKVQRQLWEYAEHLTPKEDVATYTQAIMDLGATVCTRSSPQCTVCPVSDGCSARRAQQVNRYPQPKPKKVTPTRNTYVLVLRNPKGDVLLEKRPATGIWGGLWSLPQNQDPLALLESVKIFTPKRTLSPQGKLTAIQHKFSHFTLKMEPVFARSSRNTSGIADANRYRWYAPRGTEKIGLAAPIKKLIDSIDND